jgi:hypothetical protein
VTAYKLDKFGGMLPAWSSLLIPDGQAAFAKNAYLNSGELTGWRQPKKLRDLHKPTNKFVYRIPDRDSSNTVITAPDSFWWEHEDADTTVMKTPIVNDKYQRYYFAAPSHPPMYNTYERIVGTADRDDPCYVHGDQPPFLLGVPNPPVAPIVTVSGGGESQQLGFQVVAEGSGGFDLRSAHEIFLVPITPTGSMLITSVSFMAASDVPDVNFCAVVYTDLNGRPDILLGVGEQVTGISIDVPATSTILNSVSVISNVKYWIGIAHDAQLYANVADETVLSGAHAVNTFSNGPPDVINATGGSVSWQMWADLRGDVDLEARAYIYTWVTEFSEEGPPSLPTLVNGWSNAIWRVTVYPPVPPDPHITKFRLYRTVTSLTGQGAYFYVDEFPITQTVYEDTSDNATVALNEQLQSLYWTPPPPGLKGIYAMPNGIAVGFQANEIWFCEPYHPHAWPANYVITTEFPIIGLGVCGQSVVICTAGTPYLVTGVHPATMVLTKINLHEPCLHRGSIVATDTTVLFMSPNGLIQVSQSGAGSNVTDDWISRERWQELTPAKFVRAIKLAGFYFAFGSVSGDDTSTARQGFTVALTAQDQTSFTIWPQTGGHRLGFMLMSSPNEVDIVNCLSDIWTGTGLLIQNGGIYFYDFADKNPAIVPYKWRSKEYQMQSRKNFQAMRCWFTVPLATPPQGDRNTADSQPELAENQYGIIRVYADDKLWTTRELRKSGELLRILAGATYEEWSFEIEGRVTISNLQVATSVKELGLV